MQKINNLIISLAKEADLKQLYRLEEECFSIDRITLNKYKKFLKRSTVRIFVIKEDNKIIGSATILLRKNSYQARLYSFAIKVEHRGTNVAKKLFAYIENFLLQINCDRIQLEVKKDNLPAIKFYQKLGFIQFGEYKDYYEDGTNALRMEKTLDRLLPGNPDD